MLYLSRTGSPWDIFLYLVQSCAWAIGGWLLVTHTFRLRLWERLITGLTTGWLLYIALSNLLAHIMPLTPAYWVATAIILIAGIGLAWRSSLRLELKDWSSWAQVGVLVALTGLFSMIQTGLAIFDDYLHLPLVSIIAAGDIPPHFYGDPTVYFAYHYGLQVSAASLVRVAGLYPWKAWDLSKAFAIALTLNLGWLWIRRLTRSHLAGVLGSILITFGGRARWLLLLIPLPLLTRISASIHLVNTGADTAGNLVQALISPWIIEGGGPIPFPFAFHNGIFVPVFFVLGSTGALPFVTVLLMLLLVSRTKLSTAGMVILGLIFSTLALSGEHLFAAAWGGIALAMGIYLILCRVRRSKPVWQLVWQWGGILLIGALLSLVQGAFITETARDFITKLSGGFAVTSMNAYGFSLRWPLALPDAHLGELSIFNPGQLIVLLVELGPVLLLFPVVTRLAWRWVRRKDWLKAGLGFAAAWSFLFPMVFRYGVDRSTTRLPATAIWLWLVLGFSVLWLVLRKTRPVFQYLLGLGYTVTLLGGFVIFAVQLVAIPSPQLSYFITQADARVARLYWGRLEPHAQVLDSMPERAITVFGRASHSRPKIYEYYPDWQALIASPDPATIARTGYTYVYMDQAWWGKLTASQQEAFSQGCVNLVYEDTASGSTFRRLYDVRLCK